MSVALDERGNGGGLGRSHGRPARRSGQGFQEERLAGQAAVAFAAFRIQDPQLGPPARRAESIPGDHHLRPLADDVAAQADPRPSGELQPEARRLGERTGHRPGQLRRLEENEQDVRPAGEGGQAMKPVRRAGATTAGRHGRPRPAAGGQIRDEEVHRPALEQGAGHRQPLIERLRGQDHQPFEPDAARDGLHRIQAPGEIQPGHDRPGRLGLRHEPQSERGLATRVIAADRQAGLAGNTAGAENRVEGGEAGGHDRADRLSTDVRGSFDRPRSIEHLRHRRQRPHDPAVPTTRWHAALDPETARSCRTPAIPEGRQGGRDVEGGRGHDTNDRTLVLFVKTS